MVMVDILHICTGCRDGRSTGKVDTNVIVGLKIIYYSIGYFDKRKQGLKREKKRTSPIPVCKGS